MDLRNVQLSRHEHLIKGHHKDEGGGGRGTIKGNGPVSPENMLRLLLPMKLPDIQDDDCVLGTNSLTYISTRVILKTLLV